MAQPSEFPTDEPRVIDEPSSWFEENRKGIFAAIVLILVLSCAGVWWWQAREARESQASALLIEATGPADWQKIADTYAGTPSAPLALMRLAQASRDKSEWDASLSLTDRFIREYPRHPFFPAMQLARAQTLEAAGRTDEALRAYEAIQSAKPSHPLIGAAVLGLARIHEAKGNLTAARNVLSDFLARDRASVYTAEASQKLKSLPEAPAAAQAP